ncbi:MAG: 30S ribosomal protein S3 [Candidatus Woesearchaeota archaeon]
MIERSVIRENKKEYQIQEYISKTLKNVGLSQVKLQKTPLGEKIIIHTSRPGLVVGRKGESITRLNIDLKKNFSLENPQIEIVEVENPDLDARILAERIASNLERFGSKRFKAVMHKTMEGTLKAGALGIEILLSGKVPSQRARTWRVFEGYLKKCGHIAKHEVRVAYAQAHLKTGVVGIKVSIMPNIKLPYDVSIYDEPITVVEEIIEEKEEKPKKKTTKKAAPKKKTAPRKRAAPKKKTVPKETIEEPKEEPKEEKATKEPAKVAKEDTDDKVQD